MPRIKAAFFLFHDSCSRESPFKRVNFHRTARHSRCRVANWSFHQYNESLACLRFQRGIEQSQTATTFCRADPTKLINQPDFFEVFSESFPAKSSYVPGGSPSFATHSLIHCLAPLLQAEFDAPVVTQRCLLVNRPVAYP